jgi:hypothetical protein
LSTLLHATVYMFLHNLLNVLVQIANKMELQKTNTVVCGPIARQRQRNERLYKKPLLGNGAYNINGKWRFLFGPCRDVIRVYRTRGRIIHLLSEQLVGELLC